MKTPAILTFSLTLSIALLSAVQVGEAYYIPKLYGGGDTCQGQVLLVAGSEYGNICDDDWDLTDADTICSALSAGSAVATTTQSRFGVNSIDYVMDDVSCSYSASSINSCSWDRTDNCGSSEIAGVICSSCLSGSNYQVRLVGGDTPCEGHVMVYYNGGWGYMYGSAMSSSVADAVCRSAGYSSASTYYTYKTSSFGAGPTTYSGYQRFSVGSASCSSTASSLSECTLTASSTYFSSSSESRLAGVKCSGGSGCFYNSYSSGIYVSGSWYTTTGSGNGYYNDDDDFFYSSNLVFILPTVFSFFIILSIVSVIVRRRRMMMWRAAQTGAATGVAMRAMGATTSVTTTSMSTSTPANTGVPTATVQATPIGASAPMAPSGGPVTYATAYPVQAPPSGQGVQYTSQPPQVVQGSAPPAAPPAAYNYDYAPQYNPQSQAYGYNPSGGAPNQGM